MTHESVDHTEDTMSQVRVGLFGCGGMGKALVNQMKTLDDAVLVAGADVAEASRDAFATEYNVPVFASLTEMLNGVELDATIIAVPNSFHAPGTIESAQAGKHVFCEKPMALTLADCRAMIDACKDAGVKLQIGQVLRYLPDFKKAIDLVVGGEIGVPLHGHICRYGPPKARWAENHWRDDISVVGHNLFEVSVHEIDFARCIFGKPVAVSGWDISFDPESPLWAQATTGVIEFESGGICILTEGNFNAIGRTEVELSGSGGSIRFSWGKEFTFKSLTADTSFTVPSSEIGEGVENGNRREIREWIEAIQTGGPCTIPGEEGMANIELALAILESSKRKQRIELPLEG